MGREINSIAEIGKRIVFLFYVLSHVVYLICVVAALARPSLRAVLVAVSAFLVMFLLRQVGYWKMDFPRLSKSFPTGCALDRVPDEVRMEVENLVAEFHAPNTEWPRRAEIRHRLVELEEKVPDLVDAYRDKLRRVFAA